MPDGPSSSPIEDLIARLIRRERIANTLSREVADLHRQLFEEIAALFQKIDPTAPSASRYRIMRQERFLRDLARLIREHTPELESYLKGRLAQIGRSEAVATQGALVASLGEVGERVVRTTPVTQARMRAILNSDPFRGRTLREHSRRMGANTLDRVRTQVRLGMVAEESVQDIVRRVRGRRTRGVARGFTGGVLQTTTREAEALVRTAVTHVSNQGMLETFRENKQVVESLRWVSALDSRTSEICLALDGQMWPAGSSDVQSPPAHYNCRSVLVPEIGWGKLGLEPPPEPDRIVRDLSTVSDEDLLRKVSARRRTGDFGDVTRIPTSVTADFWFRQQRAAAQNKLIGRTRAEAFRRGEIKSLRDLIRGDNSLVPLDELLRN